MSGLHVRVKVTPRPLNKDEHEVLQLLLAESLKGAEVLRQQLRHARVIGTCGCGCRTVDLEITNKAEVPLYRNKDGVPVELELHNHDGCPILVLLHVQGGYLTELEILRADGQPIQGLLPLKDAIRRIR